MAQPAALVPDVAEYGGKPVNLGVNKVGCVSVASYHLLLVFINQVF